MPDLLTHILVVYSLSTLLTSSVDWFPVRYVPVAMVGAILPDLSKLQLLIHSDHVVSIVGVPFSWLPFHRLGGTVVVAAMGALWFDRSERRLAFGVLLGGALTQYPLDALIKRANGLSPSYLYPLSWWHPPAGGIYLSSDLWPVFPAGVLAVAVWIGRRFQQSPSSPDG